MKIAKAVVAALFAVSLTACASTEMRPLVGQPIQEAQLKLGSPEQVVDMPDGTRAYQFRWGGGDVLLPGRSTTQVTAIGNTAIANTTTTPGGVVSSKGCLLTFIAKREVDAWIIRDMRVPKQAVC